MRYISHIPKVFAAFWQEALEYRAELYVWALIDLVPFLVAALLWVNIYNRGQSLADFSLSQIITYYLVGHLITALAAVHFEVEAINNLMDGSIGHYLLKPWPYFLFTLLAELAWKALTIIFSFLPMSLIAFMAFKSYFLLPSLNNFLLLIPLLLLAFAIDYCLSCLIFSLAFFLDQGRALSHFKWIISGIFGGSVLPLVTYPQAIQALAEALPFKFMFSVPVNIYLNGSTFDQYIRLLSQGVMWLIVLVLISRHWWRKAVIKFTAVGN